MKTHHYVYKITNINPSSSKKYYIGVRSSLDSPEIDPYMGSSGLLQEDIKHFGIDNFTKEIISEWNSREEAISEEIRIHDEYDVGKNEEFYNKAKQTSTGFDTTGTLLSEEHRKKISEAVKGEKNGFHGKTHTTKQRKKWSKMRKGKTCGKNNSFYGKTHSDEAKEKISTNGWQGEDGILRRNRISEAAKLTNHKIRPVYVYNAEGELMFISKASFRKFLRENNLPCTLEWSCRNDGSPIFLHENSRVRADKLKYKGWYAKET